MYSVKRIARKDCEEYILGIHYAQRWPMISYAFGLFRESVLCGIITYGETSSAILRRELAGGAFEHNIIELTRLCLRDNIKNEASILVSRSIKLLPQNKIIVSFADSSQNHAGYVYQATNFIYTGLSVPHKSLALHGRDNVHELGLLSEFKGQPEIRQAFKRKYAGQYYYKELSRKHRYVYFHGNKRFCKAAKRALKYNTYPYPKLTDTIELLEDSFKQKDALELYDLGKELSSNDFSEVVI